MIYIHRPAEPVALQLSLNYRHDDVVDCLRLAFFGRCYLCEDKPQVINVEHLVPWSTNHALKTAWGNLFWSCGHCNNIKGDRYLGVLDCTLDNEIEKRLDYHFSCFPLENVSVALAAGESEELCSPTAKLLEDVFNGTTKMKRIESNSLRKRLSQVLIEFYQCVSKVDDVNISANERNDAKLKVESALGESAIFASFTRSLIRKNTDTLAMLRREIPTLNI